MRRVIRQKKDVRQIEVITVSLSPAHILTLPFLSFTVTTPTEKDPRTAG